MMFLLAIQHAQGWYVAVVLLQWLSLNLLAGSVYIAYVTARVLKLVCPLSTGIHMVNLGIFIVAWL